MKKKEFSQEEINIIIDDYCNKKIGLNSLGKKFNCSNGPIRRVLIENNISINISTRVKANDLKNGDKFGKLIVLQRNLNMPKDKAYYNCQCECGKIITVPRNNLLSGNSTQCSDCKYKENKQNYVGQKIHFLTILSKERDQGQNYYLCKCDCGNNVKIKSKYILTTQSCGCRRSQVTAEKNKKDITGQKFGLLTALYPIGKDKHGILWHCKCDCGNYKDVPTCFLTQNVVNSCGCLCSKGEQLIKEILINNNIPFITQKTFPDCRYPETNGILRFDFYINNNYLIEYDGSQHFKGNDKGWFTNHDLKEIQKRDEFKNQWCYQNHIPLIRIPYTHYNKLCLEDLLLETSTYVYYPIKEINSVNE